MRTSPPTSLAPTTPRARRLQWVELMQRAFAVDVSICPRCGGDMRLIALIRDHAVAEKVLRHVGLLSRGPPVGGRTAIAA